MNSQETMEDKAVKSWFAKHVDTIIILGTFATCFWTLNEKIDRIDKDLAVVKTVLIMKNIMPQEMARCEFEHDTKK